MNKHYCLDCADESGWFDKIAVWTTGSDYQKRKHLKHTEPDRTYPVNSVFRVSDHDTIRDYVVNAVASGSVEVDDQGRRSIVWLAGEKTGVTWVGGKPVAPTNAVKIVLYDDDDHIHPYPTGSAEFGAATCAKCGRPVVTVEKDRGVAETG